MFGIYEMLRVNASAIPEKTALIQGDMRVSYGSLFQAVEKMADGLSNYGLRAGDKVAVLFKNSIRLIELYFSLLRLGAVISPLNFRETPEMIRNLTDLVEADVLIYEEALSGVAVSAAALDGRKLKLIANGDAVVGDDISLKTILSQEHPNTEAVQHNFDDIVLNIFTGGTTGIPKAASHTYGGLFLQAVTGYMSEAAIHPSDVYLNYAPLFHIGGFTTMVQSLCCGATFILHNGFSAEKIVELIEREHVTQTMLIPPTLCFDLKKIENFDSERLKSVRLVRLAGANASTDNLQAVFECFPNADVFNGYGMSERATNIVCIIKRGEKPPVYNENLCVGRLSPFSEARIIDDEGKEVTAIGECGELFGRSPCMMKSYYGVKNVFTPDGWLPTGDIFTRDENGYFYFVGRKKNMIKTGGENVYSSEVERAILMHPAVEECAVLKIKDEKYGEAIGAAIVLKNNHEAVTEQEIIEHCCKYIASYKKPRRIVFVRELPHSGVGKISETEITKLFL